MNASLNEKDEKKIKSKKGRFNFVDLVLILLAVAIIATLFYVFSPDSIIRDWLKKEERNIRYTVEFVNVDEQFVDNIKKSDTVSDSVTKGDIGTVETVTYTAYSEYVLVEDKISEDGTVAPPALEAVEYKDKYTIIVTITAKANFAEDAGYTVGSTRIAVGEKMFLKFPDYVGEGYCIGVTNTD